MIDASSRVIETHDLAASRGLRLLFNGVTLRLGAGEVLELRGANGSGKSTLLRILAGLTRPFAGTVHYSGAPGEKGEEAPRHYLGHSDAIKPNETAGDQALFWARFFGRDDEVAVQALDRMGLASRAGVPGRGLSAGQRRRLAIARLLIEPRPVWLLDEPVAALDAQGRTRVEELIAEHAAEGGITVVAMHGPGFAGARTLDLAEAAGCALAPGGFKGGDAGEFS